jgi:dienelactone hydrolase
MRRKMNAALRTLVVVAIAVVMVIAALPFLNAAALILRAAGTPGPLGRIARWEARTVVDSIERIPTRDGSVRARVFKPTRSVRRAVVLVSGVHPDGIAEPRLIALARDLAGTGVNVVTPEIRDLMEYRLTAHVTDAIEDTALWTATRDDLAGRAGVGMIGVSFSGGLSVVAAGRYLCTGVEPTPADGPGVRQPPHDYAVSVVLHQAADLAVPRDQVDQLRRGIEMFLLASAAARTNQQLAADITRAARDLQARMPQPSGTLMEYVINRDVTSLGARLVPYLDQLGQDPSLSPDTSRAPAAPVYLLHGRDDNVIPPVESALLASYLERFTKVRRLESGFLSHVDVAERPSVGEIWQMIKFWKDALGEQ